MPDFQLDPRLAADTLPITDLPLSRALLFNDRRYPWVILVPRLLGIREIHHLPIEPRQQLLAESCRIAAILEQLFSPDKLNIAALGNMVPQLHLHHIARRYDDPAWPGPVWGHSPRQPYAAAEAADRIGLIKKYLADHC